MNVQDHGNGCHIEYAGGVDQTSHPRKQSTRREPMQTISVLLVLGLSAVAMTTPAAAGYRLVQTVAIAGDEGWDHPTVDSAARRLHVTHGTHVVVIDVDSGKLVGRIDNTPGVHFTVVDPELERGFISNGGAARLTIFDTKTLATIGEAKSTGENPCGQNISPRLPGHTPSLGGNNIPPKTENFADDTRREGAGIG